jgi:hypothetical protein
MDHGTRKGTLGVFPFEIVSFVQSIEEVSHVFK